MASAKPATASGHAGRIAADELTMLFPAALGAWQQTELERPLPPPVPEPRPAVRAVYAQGEHSAEITVRSGPPGGAAEGMRRFHAEVRPQNPDTLVTLSLANGLAFAATSRTADAATLEALLRTIDLDRAEALLPRR